MTARGVRFIGSLSGLEHAANNAKPPIYRKSRNYGGLKHTETREFGSMRRRSALTKPDILVELFDFAFRGKEIAPRHDSNPDGLAARGDSFCNVSPKPARKPAGVRSTPYSSTRPDLRDFQRK